MSSFCRVLVCTCAFTLATILGGCGANSVPLGNTSNSGTGPVPTVTAQAVEVNGVAPNRKQEVQFSEAMDPTTINSKTFVVTDAGGNAVPGDVTYDPNFNVGIFQPTPALETGTSYTATITTGVASTGGMHLAAPFAYSFTTRAATDSSPLEVNQVSPAANAVCVSATAQIIITFDEAPDASTVTAQNIVVTDSNGNKIATTLSTDINTTQVVVTPTSPLPSGTITVTVSGVADLADVAMQQPYTWSFSTACNTGGGGGAAAVQVVYVLNGTTLTTYNVDSQTLQATEAGSLTVPAGTDPGIAISPDDHSIYYTVYQDTQLDGAKTWVYATNTSGVPQNPAVQELDNVAAPAVDPAETLAYTITVGAVTGPSGNQTAPYQIVSYQRDPATGMLSNPTTQATYNLQRNIGGLYCSLGIAGFSTLGDELYDGTTCTAPYSSSTGTANERSVNQATGALGPDQEIYNWNSGNGDSGALQFVRNLMFNFVLPNTTIPQPGYVDVYPIQPNTTTPLIHCTTAMQSICGSYRQPTHVHPSAQYVFLNDESLVTQILRVDTNTGQMTATGSTIPYEIRTLSPDGSIVYALNYTNGGVNLQIYGFNASDASVTPGGSIFVPASAEAEWAAQRY